MLSGRYSKVFGSAALFLLILGSGLVAAPLEDLAVSQSVSPARFDQDQATMLSLANGQWLVAWDDDRAGSRKVYWQRYDSLGQKLGGNEMIAGTSDGSSLIEPRLALDTLGRIYLAYRNQTKGDLFVVRYGVDGAVDYGPLQVDATDFDSFAGPFDMAVFPDGQLVLVWANSSALGSTVEMRLYRASGSTLLPPTTVNSGGGSASPWAPAVAVAPGSGYLVVWEDYSLGRADILIRQFSGSGQTVGGELAIVPAPFNSSAQFAPKVAFSPFDKYLISWIDYRTGREVYLQRFDPVSGLVGGNRLISAGLPLLNNQNVDLAVAPSGLLTVSWSASGADNTIQSLSMDSGLAPTSLPRILNLAALGNRWNPVVGTDSVGNQAAFWTEFSGEQADISGMLFYPDGIRRLAEEVIVNDDRLGALSSEPMIVAAGDNWNLIAFADQRQDAGDIYIRAVSNDGVFAGDEQRINQDNSVALQAEPYLAVSVSKSLVVWNDSRNLSGLSGQRIFGRFGSLDGVFTETEFLISDSFSVAIKVSPKVAMTNGGAALVTWLDRRDGTPQVYGRWISPEGTLPGDDFLISDPINDPSVLSVWGGVDDAGRFGVAWLTTVLSEPGVRVVWFDAAHQEVDAYSFAPSLGYSSLEEADADFAIDGALLVAWTGSGPSGFHLYMTRMGVGGEFISFAKQITDSPMAEPSTPAISVDRAGSVGFTWVDHREGSPQIYYQILRPDLSLIDANQPVSTETPEFMQEPVIDLYQGRAWFAWSDPRQDGLNVYASYLTGLPTGVDDDRRSVLPDGYTLAQNYPNPFNPSTQIAFSLPLASKVSLSIYNTLGQEVRRLVDRRYAAGVHFVTWEGNDDHGRKVASGVYLYRMVSGDARHSRKMILLK